MNHTKDRHMLRWGLTLGLMLSSAGAYAFYLHNVVEGWWAVSLKLRILNYVIWAGVAVLAAVCVFGWTKGADGLLGWLDTLVKKLAALRWALLPVMAVLLVVFPLSLYGEAGLYLNVTWTRQAIFAWLVFLLAVCISAFWQRSGLESTVIAALSLSVVYHLVTYFPHVSNYPFSLWWSEGTRYYLGSTYLGPRIYGQELPWAMKDMTRYLIQAAPFLIEDSPLWLHRLWQVILRFSCAYLAGYLLARRFKFDRKFELILFSAWAGLFLFQGPVFYHLIVVAMLVFWLVDTGKFWQSLLVVTGASIYAGFSRVNWVPMAAILALAFYLLEVPVQGKGFKAILQYLWKPAVWTAAGLAAGLAAQQYWYVNSGNPVEIYESSFTSYMLWDRLLPNTSYAMGILPAILLVSAPLVIYLAIGLKGWRKNGHGIRVLGLAGMLLVLFFGGLVVSVKIGGGTNLHNMDMFLVLLLLTAAEIYFGRATGEDGTIVNLQNPFWLKAVAVAVPVIFMASFGSLGPGKRDVQAAAQDLAILQSFADEAVAAGEDVLFISQRHLLALDLIKDVPLVHEYEKMLLQEMVMGKNEAYMAEFGAAMAEQRYGLIVTDRLPRVVKYPERDSLAMENNVVLSDMVPLIECAYQLETELLNGSLYVFGTKEAITCGAE